ncbi:MAG: outer membrane protein assembly factor BamB, partial [Proteobacteria bacterium SW_6_67_9]
MGIQTVWQQRTGSIFNERWVRLQPWRGEDILVTANIGGQVTARDPARGKRRWQRQLDGWIAAGVAGDDGLAYVGTREGVVVAFNLDDGSERWRRDVAGELLAQPAPSDDYVVVRTVDGRIIALERDDGARRWTYTSDVPSLSLRGNSRPVPVPGGVLVGLDNGRLVALQDRVGQPIWESEIQATTGDSPIARLADIDGSIGAGRSAIYAATYQGRLARVRPQDGTIGWSEELSSYAGLRRD